MKDWENIGYSISFIEMNFLGHEGNFQRQAGVTDLIQLNSNISEFKPTVCWQIIYPQFRFIIRFKSFNHTKFLTLLFIPFNFLQKNVFYQCEYSRLGQFAIPYLNELSSIWLYEKIRDAIFFYAPYYTVHSRNVCFRKKIIMCIHP